MSERPVAHMPRRGRQLSAAAAAVLNARWILLIEFLSSTAGGFRVMDENGSMESFVPYEQGFVGRYGDPFTTFTSDRVNEGAPGTPTYPRLYEGVYPRQICPGMVGPVDDGLYYCLSQEHGYCDRRSGTCFCSVGYQGISCGECSSTHYAVGGLCYPKLLCPNDCSGAGTCHFSNGTCLCLDHRVGDDCSLPYCSAIFSPRCVQCTFDRCTGCDSGYHVDDEGGGVECFSCTRHDPRCTRCNGDVCQECTDPLLLSIRRSGARDVDAALPFDELERELPHALPFGTQDPRFFASAEVYDVVTNSSSPLNESSMACFQGLYGDDRWTCESKAVSHRVCGNPGTISFSSPEYVGYEDPAVIRNGYTRFNGNGTVRITVLRTGGGYGTVGATYRLRHGTTDGSDVTAHAHYTSSTSVTFEPGMVELSVLLGVHPDGEPEDSEFFDLLLEEAWGGARLGSQHRTRVTVVDADGNGTTTDHAQTTATDYDLAEPSLTDSDEIDDRSDTSSTSGKYSIGRREESVAGTLTNFTLVARDSLGRGRGEGGDRFAVWVEGRPENLEQTMEDSGALSGSSSAIAEYTAVEDLSSGNYSVSYRVDAAGRYLLHVALCRSGGLTGSYFSNSFFQNMDFQRVDRVMNFTWGSGPIARSATDFAGVRWTGRVLSQYTETFEFELGTTGSSNATLVEDGGSGGGDGDAARLWIDGVVVVDGFERRGVDNADLEEGGGTGWANLTAGVMHDITVEYSERRGDAALFFAWSSPSVPYETIPPKNLYWVREVGDSPRLLDVVSASTAGSTSEAYGSGTVSAVASLPSTFTIVPRDAFGNLRTDETDRDVAASDRVSAVLEAVNYDSDSVDDDGNYRTLGGVYGAAGSGGKVVTATLELLEDVNSGERVFLATYVPFVAGTHLLNVTYQEWLFEPEVHIKGSPFTVTVSPGEAFGRRSLAWSSILNSGNMTAGASANLTVRARDVVGNALWEGGNELAVYAFHAGAEAYAAGKVTDHGNGTYVAYISPTVAGTYDLALTLDQQEVADSPYSLVVSPGHVNGPSSEAYGLGTVAAVATLENTVYVQAKDRFGNNLWGPYFNVSIELYVGVTQTSVDGNSTTDSGTTGNNTTSTDTNDTLDVTVPAVEASSVTFLGNGSGIAVVTYVPVETGTGLLYVRVNGLLVSGSPLYVDVTAGPPRGANATASGSALANAIAGENSSFVIQARDGSSNPTPTSDQDHVSNGHNGTQTITDAEETIFNVTLTRIMDDDDGGDNSSETVVFASVETLGRGKYRATYNATMTGNYSLDVVDTSDGDRVVGSPFSVAVEPGQAFAPATLTWWDRQVAGSNKIYLQAVDMWKNNITRGGDLFVTRWTERSTNSLEEGTYAVGRDDTGSTAAGFVDYSLDESKSDGSSLVMKHDDFGFEANNASVTDVGNGRYEISTSAIAGDRWLEIGVVEPGGLWGTYYEDGGLGSLGENGTRSSKTTAEAGWRTKGAVDYDWGFLSPETGVDSFGASSSNHATSVRSSVQENGSSVLVTTTDDFVTSSSLFPADYFSARFSGFAVAEDDSEYTFFVTTDSNSRVALFVSGVELFNEVLQPAARNDSNNRTGNRGGRTASVNVNGRRGSVLLAAGKLTPLELVYTHTTGRASVRLEWLRRTDTSPSVIPTRYLYHLRLGYKVAVDLFPAFTEAGSSTVIWPHETVTDSGTSSMSSSTRGDSRNDLDGNTAVVSAANSADTSFYPREVIAGVMLEIMVEARDAYGNARGTGGDSIQAYAKGPGGVIFHGSATDQSNGTYLLSAWPVVAGAYQMSVLVSALEPSRWALGYRSVEQAMAGAHVLGSPIRVLVVPGEVSANATVVYGFGMVSSTAGGIYGTSTFTIRARDAMGNRILSGSTGDFEVKVFHDSAASSDGDDDEISPPVAVGEAIYGRMGEYSAAYNITVAGEYGLHITLVRNGNHISGSPFPLRVSPGPASPTTSVCIHCLDAFAAQGNFSELSSRTIKLSARDAFGNTLERGGEEWYARVSGEEGGILTPEKRNPVVTGSGTGTYTLSVRPGVAGLYELQVLLLRRAQTGGGSNGVGGVPHNFGGGGLTAEYFANTRFVGTPRVVRVDPSIRLDWGSGVPDGVFGLGSTGGAVGIRWNGYLKARLSEEFSFILRMGAGDEARLWLEDDLIIDESIPSPFNSVASTAILPDKTVAGKLDVTSGSTLRLRVEYLHHGVGGTIISKSGEGVGVRVVLRWESAGTPLQTVPPFVLYPGGDGIVGSPWRFSVS